MEILIDDIVVEAYFFEIKQKSLSFKISKDDKNFKQIDEHIESKTINDVILIQAYNFDGVCKLVFCGLDLNFIILDFVIEGELKESNQSQNVSEYELISMNNYKKIVNVIDDKFSQSIKIGKVISCLYVGSKEYNDIIKFCSQEETNLLMQDVPMFKNLKIFVVDNESHLNVV